MMPVFTCLPRMPVTHFSFLKRWLLLGCLQAILLAMVPAFGAERTAKPSENLQVLKKILEQPENQIDLARVKLTVDKMIDPSIDIEHNLNQLEAMAKQLRTMFPANANSRTKLDALRAYLHQAGPWNGYRPFQYDLDDPFGENIKNKLLPTYLVTRKGNCVSMPLLFIILGQKIGLDVTASTVPKHLFVKYRDEAGTYYNIETTSGAGFSRDVWIRQQNPMTDKAIASGIYMQPLSKKETAVLITEVLGEYYRQRELFAEQMALSELELKHYPKNVTAMLNIALIYRIQRHKHFVSKYPTPQDIPENQRAYFMRLEKGLIFWTDKATALGWQKPDEATNARYQKVIEQAKSAQRGNP